MLRGVGRLGGLGDRGDRIKSDVQVRVGEEGGHRLGLHLVGGDLVGGGATPPGIASRGLGRFGRPEARVGRRADRALGRVPCVGGGTGGVVGGVGGLGQGLGQAAGGADGGVQVKGVTELRAQLGAAVVRALGGGLRPVKLGSALLGEFGQPDLVLGNGIVEGFQVALEGRQGRRLPLKAGGFGFEALRLGLGPAGGGGQSRGVRLERG